MVSERGGKEHYLVWNGDDEGQPASEFAPIPPPLCQPRLHAGHRQAAARRHRRPARAPHRDRPVAARQRRPAVQQPRPAARALRLHRHRPRDRRLGVHRRRDRHGAPPGGLGPGPVRGQPAPRPAGQRPPPVHARPRVERGGRHRRQPVVGDKINRRRRRLRLRLFAELQYLNPDGLDQNSGLRVNESAFLMAGQPQVRAVARPRPPAGVRRQRRPDPAPGRLSGSPPQPDRERLVGAAVAARAPAHPRQPPRGRGDGPARLEPRISQPAARRRPRRPRCVQRQRDLRVGDGHRAA